MVKDLSQLSGAGRNNRRLIPEINSERFWANVIDSTTGAPDSANLPSNLIIAEQ